MAMLSFRDFLIPFNCLFPASNGWNVSPLFKTPAVFPPWWRFVLELTATQQEVGLAGGSGYLRGPPWSYIIPGSFPSYYLLLDMSAGRGLPLHVLTATEKTLLVTMTSSSR